MQFLKSAREYFTPVLTQSAFIERGVLTPEEFVRACDQFISCCPYWEWSSGKPSGICNYLPKNKQFLIAKGIPCYHRAINNEKTQIIENIVENEWNETFITHSDNQINQIKQNEIKEINELDEIEEFAISNDVNIIKCRRYTISITYDKYYQTPRCWLVGFNENGELLTNEEMFMDIIKDYADKTVTIENHPHLLTPHVYIHPCRHSIVMKHMIDKMIEHGKIPKVDQYMFLFVKFIQSVVPTIEYDFTMNVEI